MTLVRRENMHFRYLFGSAAASALLAMFAAFFASAASAQFQPPPYSYPPGGYRGAPGQDGVMRADPDDDFDEVETRAPAGAPYPYDPRAGRDPAAYEPRNPYDPRYGSNAPYDPRYGSNAPYGTQRPSGPYGALRRSRAGTKSGSAAAAPAGRGRAAAAAPDISALPEYFRAAAAAAAATRAASAAGPAEHRRRPAGGRWPEEDPKELPPQFKRQIVPYASKEPAGTIIVDTNATYLYFVQGGGAAIRYEKSGSGAKVSHGQAWKRSAV